MGHAPVAMYISGISVRLQRVLGARMARVTGGLAGPRGSARLGQSGPGGSCRAAWSVCCRVAAFCRQKAGRQIFCFYFFTLLRLVHLHICKALTL